jgi:hypothetical protein
LQRQVGILLGQFLHQFRPDHGTPQFSCAPVTFG